MYRERKKEEVWPERGAKASVPCWGVRHEDMTQWRECVEGGRVLPREDWEGGQRLQTIKHFISQRGQFDGKIQKLN